MNGLCSSTQSKSSLFRSAAQLYFSEDFERPTALGMHEVSIICAEHGMLITHEMFFREDLAALLLIALWEDIEVPI